MGQEQFVGFNVSQAETSVCVVDGTGKVLWQGKWASTPEATAAAVQRRAPQAAKIALETGPMSAWHYRSLASFGLPVVCVDARHAKAALAMQLNKTDANEAHKLQPHRVGTFKRSRDPDFAARLTDIVGLYVDPPSHAMALSIDEKSQIQALDRTQPGLPIKPGRCGTMTHDYKHHGTTTLFAPLNTCSTARNAGHLDRRALAALTRIILNLTISNNITLLYRKRIGISFFGSTGSWRCHQLS